MGITSPDTFWQEVATSSLEAHSLPDVPAAQRKLLAEKVAVLTSCESTAVKELVAFFAQGLPAEYPLPADLCEEAVALHTIANHASLNFTDVPSLRAALGRASSNETAPHMHCCCTLPAVSSLNRQKHLVLPLQCSPQR